MLSYYQLLTHWFVVYQQCDKVHAGFESFLRGEAERMFTGV